MKIPNHFHLYKRVNLTRNPAKPPYLVLQCLAPNCTHYLPKKLAIGKLAKCHRCEEPFILDKETVELEKPHCTDCIKRKPNPNIDGLADFVRKI